MLDPLGELTIWRDVVYQEYYYIWWVFLQVKKNYWVILLYLDLFILDNYTFIGVVAIVLLGSSIDKYCILGAGCVIKGKVED